MSWKTRRRTSVNKLRATPEPFGGQIQRSRKQIVRKASSVSNDVLSSGPSFEDSGEDKVENISSQKTSVAEKLIELSRSSRQPTGSIGSQGLSKFHQSLLSQNSDRQRFVTGKYPLRITVQDNPTRKWLGMGRPVATAHLLVNGTSADRSLASFDRFQWIDDEERQELADRYSLVSLELLAEINVKRPGYINVLPAHGAGSSASLQRARNAVSWNNWKRNSLVYQHLEDAQCQAPYLERIWITGFSLASTKGFLQCVDAETGQMESVNARTASSIRWPNESNSVPSSLLGTTEKYGKEPAGTETSRKVEDAEDALLVSDGFLVPGKDKGGLYLVKNPGNDATEWVRCLTGGQTASEAWFYHRAVWVDLTGDGRQSILTARAKAPSVLKNGSRLDSSDRAKSGQLVWLEMPKPHSIDKETGTPLEKDGTVFDPFSARHLPWKIHVLDEGPDVMFAVADLDIEDDTVEVISSQFFERRVVLHSIHRGPQPVITFRRSLDDKCGAAFGTVLADLDSNESTQHGHRRVVDSGSTVGTQKPGDLFSHVLVTSHECSFDERDSADNTKESVVSGGEGGEDGGSLFAYRVPEGKRAWKTEPWLRTTVASGFRVKGQLGNVINPGAPGFVYTFYSKKGDVGSKKRPLLAVAGDCAESAYIFRPAGSKDPDGAAAADPAAKYKLMTEIECGSTVGSIGIGYSNFCSEEQKSGYAKLYIPCYEKDKVYVFAMGDGEDDFGIDAQDGW